MRLRTGMISGISTRPYLSRWQSLEPRSRLTCHIVHSSFSSWISSNSTLNSYFTHAELPLTHRLSQRVSTRMETLPLKLDFPITNLAEDTLIMCSPFSTASTRWRMRSISRIWRSLKRADPWKTSLLSIIRSRAFSFNSPTVYLSMITRGIRLTSSYPCSVTIFSTPSYLPKMFGPKLTKTSKSRNLLFRNRTSIIVDWPLF